MMQVEKNGINPLLLVVLQMGQQTFFVPLLGGDRKSFVGVFKD